MEKIGPIPPPHAAQALARLIPLGQGWVLEPQETGFLLRRLMQEAQAVQIRVSGEEAQALRQGEVTPEQMAQRHGVAVPHPPPGAVTVAFSDEALRLSGKPGAAGPGKGDLPRGPNDTGAGVGLDLPRAARIGAVVAALLLLALIWAT